MRIRALACAITGAALLLTGCGGTSSGGAAPPQKLTVFAAASLTEAFNGLEKQFEADNPGVDVVYNYGSSADLAQQIVNGAPVDVFAAASDTTMKTVTDAGLANGAPAVFATNVLQIATVPGNPKGITTFADLAKPDLKVVVCAPQAPCGAAAVKVEKATGVTLKPVSEEPDVKSTLGKVSTGNADAGLVYVTDVSSAKGKVQGVSFPEADKARTNYPVAVLKNAPQAQAAAAFQALITGEQGQKALQAVGFGKP